MSEREFSKQGSRFGGLFVKTGSHESRWLGFRISQQVSQPLCLNVNQSRVHRDLGPQSLFTVKVLVFTSDSNVPGHRRGPSVNMLTLVRLRLTYLGSCSRVVPAIPLGNIYRHGVKKSTRSHRIFNTRKLPQSSHSINSGRRRARRRNS